MIRQLTLPLHTVIQVPSSKAKFTSHILKMSSHSFHDSHSNTYDRMASGATLNIARVFLPTLAERYPITKDSYILDNACGTGIVSLTFLGRIYSI